ncbi:hypothetical protein B0H13DRAFT_1895368 [Mycena leptocephala]|nr:hypothetical protein B0H13DRAFT_1895368 [Mycena leptocephala]
MTLSIALVPEDILLEFAKQLDIADLLSFLSVCRTIRALRFQGPFGWMLLSGYVSQSRRELYLGAVSAAGTSSPVIGWRTLNPRGSNSYGVCVEIMGKALIGTTHMNVKNFGVICIDFHDRAHIAISHVISPPTNTTDDPFGRRSFFINALVMGSCTTSDIICWPLDSNVTAQIEPPHVANSNSCYEIIHMSAFGWTLYILPVPPLASQTKYRRFLFHRRQIITPRIRYSTNTLTIPYPIGSSPPELGARHGTTGSAGLLTFRACSCHTTEFLR